MLRRAAPATARLLGEEKGAAGILGGNLDKQQVAFRQLQGSIDLEIRPSLESRQSPAVSKVLTSAPVQECGPAAEHPRRSDAVRLARHINTAEAQAFMESRAFQPLDEITGLLVPEGFTAQLLTNDSRYIFTIKDAQDPCGFAVFSDEKGIIYLAQALR